MDAMKCTLPQIVMYSIEPCHPPPRSQTSSDSEALSGTCAVIDLTSTSQTCTSVGRVSMRCRNFSRHEVTGMWPLRTLSYQVRYILKPGRCIRPLSDGKPEQPVSSPSRP
ncbi:hypothetical protein LIA77_00920 [Sarocladium implicatum]|nr:hypothetical protein LIA77_00920 [Sarocladium implicatum]